MSGRPNVCRPNVCRPNVCRPVVVEPFFLKKKVIYVIYKILDSRDRQKKDKKGHQKFLALKWTFFLKKGHSKIWCAQKFFPSPKLDAKSPPMSVRSVLQLTRGG